MSKFIINIDELEITDRKYDIFYATHDHIIYRERFDIVMSDCEGNVVSKVGCPRDYFFNKVTYSEDSVQIFLAGKKIVTFDKSGIEPIVESDICNRKVGRGQTKAFQTGENSVIFGCQCRGQLHIVNYDFVMGSRLSQSSSWKMNQITDFQENNESVYAILDNTFIVECNKDTCETKWTRFEAGFIYPKILFYQDKVLYTCHGMLKEREGSKVYSTKVPMLKFSSLEGVVRNDLIATSNERKNICCFDMKKQKLKWEIKGKLPIDQIEIIKGKSQSKIRDIAILRIGENLGVIDLEAGKSAHFIKMDKLFNISVTEDHVLLHKSNHTTSMIGAFND